MFMWNFGFVIHPLQHVERLWSSLDRIALDPRDAIFGACLINEESLQLLSKDMVDQHLSVLVLVIRNDPQSLFLFIKPMLLNIYQADDDMNLVLNIMHKLIMTMLPHSILSVYPSTMCSSSQQFNLSIHTCQSNMILDFIPQVTTRDIHCPKNYKFQ